MSIRSTTSAKAIARRGILYVRRSTDQQADSLTGQVEWAIREAAAKGIALDVTTKMLAEAERNRLSCAGDLYLDDAITGGDMRRPGYLAFVQRAIDDPAVTDVLYYLRDRLARPDSPAEAVLVEATILNAGKRIITASGMYEPHMRGDIGHQVTALVQYHQAAEYRIKLAKNVLRGQTLGARKGRWEGGRAPYGFVRMLLRLSDSHTEILPDGRTIKDDGYKVIVLPGGDAANVEKQEVVRRIAFDYYNGVSGLPGIPRPDQRLAWREARMVAPQG